VRWTFILVSLGVGFAALTIAAPLVRAQNLGIKFGLSSSDQTSTQSGGPFPIDVEAVKHPTVGLQLSFPLGRWRIAPTINYIAKGRDESLSFYVNSGYVSGSVYVYDELHYLSVQNDFHLTFGIGTASFYLLAAPRLDVLLDQKTTWAVDENYFGALPKPELSAYESLVFGAAIGIGQDIKVGRHTVVLEVRYDRDLTSAWDLQASSPYLSGSGNGPETIYNRTFMIQLGLRLWTSKPEPVLQKDEHWPPANPPPHQL
jgi:hypothetical protein